MHEFNKCKARCSQLSDVDFDTNFNLFLKNNFARKSQKLDKMDFELTFYQTLFNDVLSKNEHAKITDFVCPTSSRPSVESQRKKTEQNPDFVPNKLASKYRTINSAYLHTIFESENFKQQMYATIDKYLEKFAKYQIKSKFEILTTNWRGHFTRSYLRTIEKGPREVLNHICKEINGSQIKLAWPIVKVQTAKTILKRDFERIFIKA